MGPLCRGGGIDQFGDIPTMIERRGCAVACLEYGPKSPAGMGTLLAEEDPAREQTCCAGTVRTAMQRAIAAPRRFVTIPAACTWKRLSRGRCSPAAGFAADPYLIPHAGSTASGYTPAQIRAAYGFNNVSFGSTAADGRGQTIAIIDAYNDPNIASDLAAFDSGLRASPRRRASRSSTKTAAAQLAGHRSEPGLGRRNGARRRMGACHRSRREHPARRGQ